jgi:hypothetical protein
VPARLPVPPAPSPLPVEPVASTSTLPTASSPSTSGVGVEGGSISRKRSKWDDQAALEDELAIKIRRKNKAVAQERRRRERSADAREREARLGAFVDLERRNGAMLLPDGSLTGAALLRC